MPRLPPHKVLVVGAGSIGERHVRCFQATGRCELSFVEIQPLLRQAVAQRCAVRGFADLEEAMVERPDVAVVAVPAHLHVRLATQVAEAGAHVLIEKPLSASLDGIEQLRDTVRRRAVTCGVAYVYRSHPVLAAMRDAIASGRFGRTVEVVAVSGQHFPTYRPAYRDIYYTKHSTGGGAIQDALTHVINAGEWLVGSVTRVVADAAHQVLAGVDVEDTVHVLARHGDVLASYSLNQHQAPNESTITVVGELGTARFESHEGRWRWMTTPGGTWHDEPHESLERDSLFIAQAHRFLDAVESSGPFACTLEQGLATLRVNRAILASVERGGWQNVPAES